MGSLSVISGLLSHPTHFLSPAKENGGKECRQGQAPAPHARKTQPTRPSVSRLRTLLAKVKRHIENRDFSLSIAVGFVSTRVFGLPLSLALINISLIQPDQTRFWVPEMIWQSNKPVRNA
jgi:hypothetical protein